MVCSAQAAVGASRFLSGAGLVALASDPTVECLAVSGCYRIDPGAGTFNVSSCVHVTRVCKMYCTFGDMSPTRITTSVLVGDR